MKTDLASKGPTWQPQEGKKQEGERRLGSQERNREQGGGGVSGYTIDLSRDEDGPGIEGSEMAAVGAVGREETGEREVVVSGGEELGGREVSGWLGAGGGARFFDRILAACSSFARLRDHGVARAGVPWDVPAGVEISESDILDRTDRQLSTELKNNTYVFVHLLNCAPRGR